jgi:hypothetical protein
VTSDDAKKDIMAPVYNIQLSNKLKNLTLFLFRIRKRENHVNWEVCLAK